MNEREETTLNGFPVRFVDYPPPEFIHCFRLCAWCDGPGARTMVPKSHGSGTAWLCDECAVKWMHRVDLDKPGMSAEAEPDDPDPGDFIGLEPEPDDGADPDLPAITIVVCLAVLALFSLAIIVGLALHQTAR